MNRVKDYVQFAVWFVGLGYMVLWPLTAHDNGISMLGAAFGAADVCGIPAVPMIDVICDPLPMLRLSPGLQFIGAMSAVYVIARLLLRQWHHVRQQRLAPTGAADGLGHPLERNPVSDDCADRVRTMFRRLNVPPPPPPRAVRPRRQFGLRGVPH